MICLCKALIKASLLQIAFAVMICCCAFSQKHPVYPPDVSDIESLKKSVAFLTGLSVKEVVDLVPTKSGFYFIGCPNCNGGAEEAEVLKWKPGMGDKVRCNFCHMEFPNEKFPNNREVVITAPSGVKQVYRYYENPQGRQYFYEAHAWYDQWLWINRAAERLAGLWIATGDNIYGDRAAAIAGRFAQVFPDYAVRYDYPNQPKRFFPANQKWPYKGLSDHRGAKWSWWAYNDTPAYMTLVYDMLNTGYDWKRMDAVTGTGTKQRVVTDLLRLGYEFATAHPEDYSNMGPFKYRDMIRLGRVLGEPAMVHDAVNRFRELLSRGFFADGSWKEGAPSYHNQTIHGLRIVNAALKGYTDPVDWEGERFENLDLTVGLPLYRKALDVSLEATLPNGRVLPLNDSWSTDTIHQAITGRTTSRLWSSLGNAALGAGEGNNQIMLNINWSGNYGHSHSDNGSIILYAAGEELLPDIGYTHTRYKSWAMTTASHNTVVIDQKEQDKGSAAKPVTGNLLFYDDKDAHVKVIDLDASPAYEAAKTYRRRLVMVNAGPGRDYIVDRFDVDGGQDHDWFLHGMCEQEGALETSITLDKPLDKTLVPDWGGKELPQTQYQTDPKRFHPYVFLRDVKTGSSPSELWTATWRYDGGSGLRVHHISPQDTRVFRFRSPSVRRANEDDNKLDDFMHSGIMQRHSGKASSFITVHEPFKGKEWIESVSADGDDLMIRYTLNGTPVTDRVSLDKDEITVNSSAGWKYRSGKPHQGLVKALETGNDKWRLHLDQEAPEINYVRLDFAGGVTRYYPVNAVRGEWLELAYDPGFTIEADSGKVVFHSFPKDQYSGPLRYTLFKQ